VADRLDAEPDDVGGARDLDDGVGGDARGDDGPEADGDEQRLGRDADGVADDRQQRLAASDGQRAADGEEQAGPRDLDEEDRRDEEGDPLAR
jgi:hypothetical protein